MKTLARLLLVIILSGLSGFSFAGCGGKDKPLEQNFVDPNQIAGYSLFGSCCGHIYPDNVSTSQKHYLNPIGSLAGSTGQIKIFAPCTGTITKAEGAEGGCSDGATRGSDVSFVCKKNRKATIIFFHQDLVDGLGVGSVVKAGDQLSTANVYCASQSGSSSPNFDVAYIKSGDKNADSVFRHMSDDVLKAWQTRGLNASNLDASGAQSSSCDFSNSSAATSLCMAETISF